jgi:hypothetical protein
MQHSILFILLLVFSVVTHGQVYKWVDQDGNTQYTDQPPPTGAAQDEHKLNIKSPPPQSADSKETAPRSLNDEMQGFKERRLTKQEAEARQQIETEEKERNCIDAQGKLKLFRDAPRLAVSDGKGGITYADDDMRQEKISEAKNNIATYCNE